MIDEIRVTLNTYDCTRSTDINQLFSYGKWTQDSIERAEALIEAAKEYQKQIAARVAELATMPYKYKIELKRERRYYQNNKVFYYLTIYKLYEDGSQGSEQIQTYTGKERNKAIADYKKLVKQYPGAEYSLNIEKERWEK